MKYVILSLCLVLFSTRGYSQNANPDSLKVLQIRASDTDPLIPFELGQHYTFYNPTAIVQNTLVLHLVGSFDNPLNTIKYPSLAANNGFHVISLKYSNSISSQGACKNSTDSNCYSNFREEIISGTDVSGEVDVDSINSIDNRLLKLLVYLQNEFPTNNWEQYFESDAINWNKVIVSGHSQGGGHAAYLGKTRLLKRIIMFSSPNDWSNFFNAPAHWLNDAKTTPISRYFGFNNINDDVVDFSDQYQIWQNLGLTQSQDTIAVNDSTFINSGSTILYTDFNKSGTSANHNATVRDSDTPQDINGTALFEPVWLYLLGIYKGAAVKEIEHPQVLAYPNPTSDYLHLSIDKIDQINVYNSQGKEILKESNAHNVLDVSDWTNGLYFATLTTSNAIYRFTFLKN